VFIGVAAKSMTSQRNFIAMICALRGAYHAVHFRRLRLQRANL
jgi:hypothetical protein